MAEQVEKPFHQHLKPESSETNIDIISSLSSIDLGQVQPDSNSVPENNDFGSAEFLLQSAQSNYPCIRKPPPPPSIKQNPKSSHTPPSQIESDEKKPNVPTQTKKPGISNLFSSAKRSLSRGAKTVSSKTAERMSLEGQLKQARISLERFLNPTIIHKQINVDKAIPKWVLKGAKGIVFLTVVKAGFLFAGSVGTGCVLVKQSNGTWSGPSSIGMAGVAAGLLVGASKIDYIMILPNENAVKQFTGKGQLRLGGEVQLAVGPLGRDASGSVGTGDKGFSVIYSYSHAAGLYGGLGLDGKVISVRPKCNELFYGEKVSVSDILLGKLDCTNIQNEDYELITHLLAAYCIDDIDDEKEEETSAAVFGRDMNDVECSKVKQYVSEIPNVLLTLKDALYKYEAHLTQGIFRTVPPQKELETVKKLIDEGKLNDIDFEPINPALIAELIKEWFRQRPVKILHKMDEQRMENVETVSDAQDIVDAMAEPTLTHFYWLLDLCIDIGKYSDTNGMTANDMAIAVASCVYDTEQAESIMFNTCVVQFISLSIELRMEMLHLDEANKIMDDMFDNDNDSNVQNSIEQVASKPDIPL